MKGCDQVKGRNSEVTMNSAENRANQSNTIHNKRSNTDGRKERDLNNIDKEDGDIHMTIEMEENTTDYGIEGCKQRLGALYAEKTMNQYIMEEISNIWDGTEIWKLHWTTLSAAA